MKKDHIYDDIHGEVSVELVGGPLLIKEGLVMQRVQTLGASSIAGSYIYMPESKILMSESVGENFVVTKEMRRYGDKETHMYFSADGTHFFALCSDTSFEFEHLVAFLKRHEESIILMLM